MQQQVWIWTLFCQKQFLLLGYFLFNNYKFTQPQKEFLIFDELEMKSAFRQYAEILDGIEKSFEVYSENCG